PAERAAGSRVLEDVDRAVGRRAEAQRLDRRRRPIDVELGLVAFALLPEELRIGARRRLEVSGLDLLEPLLGVRERELGLVELDPRDEVALAEIELRALDVVLRLHQVRRLLLRDDLRLRQRLVDFPLGAL